MKIWELKNELKDKKILILGLGKEGLDALFFLKKIFPEKEIGVADVNEDSKFKITQKKFKKIKWYLGKNYLKSLKNYNLIIKSPGIPIHLPEIEKAFKEHKITSSTEIFLKYCEGKVIGVTGTKGKSTTANLIYKILKEGGLKVHLIGNIGRPSLNYLLKPQKGKLFVFELSAQQLYNLKISPQIAIFLNFFPDHLDYFSSLEEYLRAKSNITLWQSKRDYFIYNLKDKNIQKIAKKTKAKKIPISENSKIVEKIKLKKYPFFGKFWRLHLGVAIKVGEIFGLEKEIIKVAIEKFKSLPHRLEYVGEFKGIKFFNDSQATIPAATISALNSLENKVGTIILGGWNKGISFKELAKEILKKKIKNLILFPESGKEIWDQILKIKKKKLPKAFFVKKMKEAVKLAFNLTPKGQICLLSPASASFGLFRDYKERGNQFKKYVKYYGKKS